MNTLAISIVALGLCTLASPVSADVIGGGVTGGSALTAGGTFVQLSPPWGNLSTPANTVGNNNFNTSNLYAFNEAQNFTLTTGLDADVGLTRIPAGTVVSSHFVFFDPGPSEDLIGKVDFNANVLAIITSDSLLVASNHLGDSGITYMDPVSVGLEAGDLVTIDTSNPNQIDWNTTASDPGDAVRVITGAATTTPEPASPLLFGLGLICLAGAVGRKLFT